MFRLWARVFANTHMVKDLVVEDSSVDTRTHKVFNGLEKACEAFDLAKPIWLDKNVREFKRMSRTKFYQDNFIEEIDFDYLDLKILEED